MTVHEVARQGFGSEAPAYERARPGYPPDAVAWLCDHLRIAAGAQVLDLAAGTGKLTRSLVHTGADVVAAEPIEGMWRVLATSVPSVPITAGTAERLPFRASSFDAVTVAQAFHWFERDTALPELHRVLRPNGRLGLIWNRWDASIDRVRRLRELLASKEASAPWMMTHLVTGWQERIFAHDPHFAPVERAQFSNDQVMSHAGVAERLTTTSHVAALPAAERAAVVSEVHAILDSDPETRDRAELVFPYVVEAFWSERT
ncbi:MAG: class I SAM-dependent methyltransferase [Actinomycetota bacterium]